MPIIKIMGPTIIIILVFPDIAKWLINTSAPMKVNNALNTISKDLSNTTEDATTWGFTPPLIRR